MNSRQAGAEMAEQKKTVKSRKGVGGRPSKYPKIDLEQVEKLGALGLIDEEIAFVLGISLRSLNNYKKKPEFLQAIKKGKTVADQRVVESLRKRAEGFEYEEVYVEYKPGAKGAEDKKAEPTLIKKTKKYVPPDTAAAIFWITNRQPDRWKNRFEHGGRVTLPVELSITELKKSFGGYDKIAGEKTEKKEEKKELKQS